MTEVQILTIVMGVGSAIIAFVGVMYGQRVLSAVQAASQTREEIKDHITGLMEGVREDLHEFKLDTVTKCTELDGRTSALERDVKKLYSLSRG